MQDIVVLGGSGDGLVVSEAIRAAAAGGAAIRCAGYLNDALPPGDVLGGHPVLGKLDDWASLPPNYLFIPAIQKLKQMRDRAARVERLGIPRERWATVIHPMAFVSSDTRIGVGVYIASNANVQPGCSIGDFASLRSGAMLGHHCDVSDHGYVGPNAVMCGGSKLGIGAFLGPGAVLLDTKSMGDFSIAGINAAVTKSVPENRVVFGNPARIVLGM